jgi:hypothetical protein
MPITFPEFEKGHFFWITACGDMPSLAEDIQKWMKEQAEKAAPFNTARGNGLVEIMIGGRSGKHFHVDVFSPEMRLNKAAKAKSTVEDIQKSVERLIGKEINANFRGGFQAKLTELPESGIIRTLFIQTKIGNVALKVDGARISIEGAPVRTISWHTAPKELIQITIETELVKTTISADYLTIGAGVLQKAFDVFILGKSER